jgi:hypothetical protein
MMYAQFRLPFEIWFVLTWSISTLRDVSRLVANRRNPVEINMSCLNLHFDSIGLYP